MTTNKGNRIICRFMGKTYNPDAIYLYHDRWEELMPVVEKIVKWHDEESDKYFAHWLELCDKNVPDPWRIFDLKITEKIDFVYVEVLVFIMWYNTHVK